MIEKETKTIVNRMAKGEDLSLDTGIWDKIFENPIIRDLPKYAEMFGLYSSFIVGQQNVYFVYGYDGHMIHDEPFIEAHNWISPICELEDYGYGISSPVIRKSWNACRLNEDMVNYSAIHDEMANLELLHDRYRLYGIEMPEFIYFPYSFGYTFNDLVNMIDNGTTVGTKEWREKVNREQEILKGISIPEWPICPENEKPGILAFIGVAACVPDSFRKIEKVYNNPSLWKETYEKTESTGYVYNDMDKKEADFLFKNMDAKGYFYHIASDKKTEKREFNENCAAAKILNASTGLDFKAKEPGVTFGIDEHAINYVMYLLDKYQYMLQKENLQTDEMYKDLTGNNNRNEPAYFVFGVPGYLRGSFQEFCEKMNVECEYANAYTVSRVSNSREYYMTPVYNMPAVEIFLQQGYGRRFSEHFDSTHHDAPAEYRTRDMNGVSCYIQDTPWHTIKESKAPDLAWCVSLKDMEKVGHYQDNNDC